MWPPLPDGGRQPLPPLLGVPVAVKDVLAVEGMPVGCGSALEPAGLLP